MLKHCTFNTKIEQMDFKELLTFLKELKDNNNREWFEENKKRYKVLQENFTLFIEMLINEIGQFDKEVAGIPAKKAVFRIYRDVRFSKDKSPYKTNFGGFIVAGGKSSGKAGYYLHIDPQGSFLAGGIYMPPTPVINLVRESIVNNTEDFLGIINDSDFKKYFGSINGEKLKRPPKGFPADFKEIELLKFKSYTVMHSLDEKELQSESLFSKLVDGFELMSPLNKFINHALIA